MFADPITKAHKSHKRIRETRNLLSLFIVLAFTASIFPTKAHAQIIGELEANIPFQFHAGDTKLPPGKYIIRPLDNSDLTLMEITSVDGSTSALFTVRDAQANSTPAKNELVFNKYGNRYFLAKLFDEGNPSGSTVDKSRYEKKVGEAAAEEQVHVPVLRRGQHGDGN